MERESEREGGYWVKEKLLTVIHDISGFQLVTKPAHETGVVVFSVPLVDK